MKKIISLLLVAIIGISLCACGGYTTLVVEKEGVACINEEKFGEILERVELTVENWRDHIKCYSYQEEIVSKDAFGEVVSTGTVTRYVKGESCLKSNRPKWWYVLG